MILAQLFRNDIQLSCLLVGLNKLLQQMKTKFHFDPLQQRNPQYEQARLNVSGT